MDKEKDIFSEIIKEKLSNYSLPVDNNSWDKIEEQLNSTSRAKTKYLWMAAIAVAASITLLFLLFPFNKKVYQDETANQLSDHEEKIIQIVSEKEIVQSDLQQNVEYPTVFRKSQSGKQLAENELAVKVIPEEAILEEVIPDENQVAQAVEDRVVPKNPQTPYVPRYNSGDDVIIPAIKNKKRRSINLSIGSGSNLLASNETSVQSNSSRPSGEIFFNNEIAYFKSVSQDVKTTQAEIILLNEEYPDAIHYPPVSIGVTLKKELSRNVAIESGIVYSYITSTFSRESFDKSKADLQLHYIGVPLNLHTRLYTSRNNQWGIYLSTGGMVEKGLLLRLVQKTFFNDIDNTVKTVTSSEKINGLQWSVNVSPGFDYQIYKNYSIYVEPKFSYYFDNDQPESARTKHPVVIGINAGLRFDW